MTFPAPLALTVLLDGVDVTDYVQPSSIAISNVLTAQVDTCILVLEDAGILSPRTWQELVVQDGTERLFAGYVLGVEEVEGADLGIDYRISASDYAIRLEKVIVKAEYQNQTDAEILSDLFARYLPGDGYDVSTYVQSLKTYPRIRFNRLTLLECVLKLAMLSHTDWYVDEHKRLHFFETDTSTEAAPFSLSDNPDKVASMPYYDYTIYRDGAGIANRVEVLGGNYLSENAEFIEPGTGQDPRIKLAFRLHPPVGETTIKVWRNDGTASVPVWTPMTIKVGYVDQLTGPNEILYYYQEKAIEQLANWPNLPNAVRIQARHDVPLRARVQDGASIAHYDMVMDAVIVDEEITDKDVARLAGMAKLAASSMETKAVSLRCDQPGLRAGQKVRFINATHGLDADYLVRRVMATVGINGRAKFDVELGTYNPDLIDLLLMLARLSRTTVPWRDDEVLDEFLPTSGEIGFADSADMGDSAAPYFFSENPADAFDWGFGSFDPLFGYLMTDDSEFLIDDDGNLLLILVE